MSAYGRDAWETRWSNAPGTGVDAVIAARRRG
jgi:hypothetical protein